MGIIFYRAGCKMRDYSYTGAEKGTGHRHWTTNILHIQLIIVHLLKIMERFRLQFLWKLLAGCKRRHSTPYHKFHFSNVLQT